MGTCNEGSTWRTLFSTQQNSRVQLWILLVMIYVVICQECILNTMISSIWSQGSSDVANCVVLKQNCGLHLRIAICTQAYVKVSIHNNTIPSFSNLYILSNSVVSVEAAKVL